MAAQDCLSMLGAELLAGPSAVSTARTLASTKFLGLYFSAHWCGPCRAFTPKLAESYPLLHRQGVQVLFVSADHTEASFLEYYAQMPWKAVPFSRPRQAIGEACGVQGIPKLVILDQAGNILLTEGVELLKRDPSGQALLQALQPHRATRTASLHSAPPAPQHQSPSPPPATAAQDCLSMLGSELLAGPSVVSTARTLASTKFLGLYFSAHWCGPCRAFTPKLAESYPLLHGQGVQVLFVSADHTEASFMEYYAQMPWKAVPFSRPRQAIGEACGVQGIPKLVILDQAGNILLTEGVELLKKDPSGQALLQALQPYRATRAASVRPLSSMPAIQEAAPVPEDNVGFLEMLSARSRSNLSGCLSYTKWLGICFALGRGEASRQLVDTLQGRYPYLRSLGMRLLCVSLDEDEADFDALCADMPWPVLSFSNDRRSFAKQFALPSVPAFLVLRTSGTIVTPNGAELLQRDPSGVLLVEALHQA